MADRQISAVIEHLHRMEILREAAGRTDGQLLEDYICRRDEAAFAALVRRHGPMVWGVCRRVLRNHTDAEDAFQASFLVLVRKAASIAPRDMVGNWLYGVAHQTALNARATVARRKGRERQVVEMPEPAVKEQELLRDLQLLLDEELSHLPDKYRVPIILCDLEGKSRKEAAHHLGCPEGTVAGRLARARAMLATRLARHGLAVSGGTLAAMLSQSAAAAGVLPAVVSGTIKIGSLLATGQATAAGVISAEVAALTEGVLTAMLLTKLKMAMAVLLVAGVGLMGLAYGMQAGGQTESQERKQEPGVNEKKSEKPARLQDKEETRKDARGDQTRLIEGVVKEVDEKTILLVGGERVLLNDKTEFLRETGLDAAPAKLTEVTKGKLIYIQTKKQAKLLVAVVVVLRLLQPPDPKGAEEPNKDAKDGVKKAAGLNVLDLRFKKLEDDDLQTLPKEIDGLLLRGHLGYGSNTVTDEGIKHLTRFHRLRILAAGGLGLTDRALETIGKLSTLEELSLDSNHITGAGLRHLAGLKRLRRLDLNFNPLDAAAIEALVGLPELTTLRINSTKPVDDRLCDLCSRLPRLQELLLGENTRAVSDRGLERLAKLEHLENLSLSGSPLITDAGLAKIARLKHLRMLHLSDLRSVTPKGMKILGKLTELRSLEIDSVRMDEASVRSLTPLTKLENLLLWNVSNHQAPISLDGLGQLRSLRTFRTQMPVSSSAIRALARLPELESISDELFEITDEDLVHLAHLPKLKTLVLASPKVTAAALPTLAKMTSLRELYVTKEVGVTPEQWTQLGQSSLSQCRIACFRQPYTVYHDPKR